jgi:hypothetical protein
MRNIGLLIEEELVPDDQVWDWLFKSGSFSDILDELEMTHPNLAHNISKAKSLADVKQKVGAREKALRFMTKLARQQYDEHHWHNLDKRWERLVGDVFNNGIPLPASFVKHMLYREMSGGVWLSDNGDGELTRLVVQASKEQIERVASMSEFVAWLQAQGARQGKPSEMT